MRLQKSTFTPSQSYKRVAPMTYQEMAFAPALLQQRQEKAEAELNADQEALNFEYLQQDDPLVRKQIKGYQDRLDGLSKQLAGSGIGSSTPTRQDIVKFKRDYIKDTGIDGVIGQAQKNYKTAMDDWGAREKDLRATEGVSEDFIQRNKKSFFGKYQGSQDEFGNYRPFEAGKTANYYNVGDDAIGYLKNAGYMSSNADLAAAMPNIEWIQKKAPWGGVYMGAVIKNPGMPGSSNASRIAVGLDELSQQYSNPSTDRGAYSEMSGMKPEDIQRTLSNTARMMVDEKDGTAPSVRLQGQMYSPPTNNGSSESSNSNTSFYPTSSELTTNPEAQKLVNKNRKIMASAFTDKKFNSANIPMDEGVWADVKNSFKWYAGAVTGKDYAKSSNKQAAEDLWNEYTTGEDYKPLYNSFTNGTLNIGGIKIPKDNEELYFKVIDQLSQQNVAYENSLANLSNYDIFKDIANKGLSPTFTKINTYKKGNPVLSDKNKDVKTRQELADRYGAKKLEGLEGAAFTDAQGNLVVELDNNGEYERWVVDGLPIEGLKAPKALKQISDVYTDYKLTAEEIATANETPWVINGNIRARMFIDPTNPLNRGMYYEQKVKQLHPVTGLPILDQYGNEKFTWEFGKTTNKSQLFQISTDAINKVLRNDRTTK